VRCNLVLLWTQGTAIDGEYPKEVTRAPERSVAA
jgi:hypothetical protein